jgi:hypothetical protein
MVFWNAKGDIKHRALYDLAENPVEQDRDLAETNPRQADALQAILLRFLKSVDAEKPADFPPKRRGANAEVPAQSAGR